MSAITVPRISPTIDLTTIILILGGVYLAAKAGHVVVNAVDKSLTGVQNKVSDPIVNTAKNTIGISQSEVEERTNGTVFEKVRDELDYLWRRIKDGPLPNVVSEIGPAAWENKKSTIQIEAEKSRGAYQGASSDEVSNLFIGMP